MNQQRYGRSRSPVPRRAGLAQSIHNQAYSDDMVDADDYEGEYDDQWPPPVPRSAVRYTTTPPSLPVSRVPAAPAPTITVGGRRYVLHANSPPQQAPRRNTPPPQPQVRRVAPPPPQAQYDDEEDEPQPRQRRHLRVHPLVVLGFAMALMLALWVLGNMLFAWWNVTQDDWHYGRPRTFQTDAVVSHHDSASNPSHFIVLNYRAHVVVIEFPGGDTTKARLYQGPALYGDGQDLTAVTLAFKDINSDAKPDMILVVGATHIAFINDNGQFRLLKPGEVVSQY